MKTKKLIYVLFLIATIICTTSCGTRKTQQTKTDVTTKEVVTDNSTIETKTDSNLKVIDCTSTDEIEIIPIDNTKEIIVNNKSYKNVRIKYKKTKNNVITTERKKVAETIKKDVKTKYKAKVEVKQKETERNSNYWWLLLLIPIYLLYRKYKHKFTNVG
jgi:sorbitol-specific phosphotransferase system component IIBC